MRPMRIGHATVVPGDVVLGSATAGSFLSRLSLAEEVVKRFGVHPICAIRSAICGWNEKKYTAGQIDTRGGPMPSSRTIAVLVEGE